MRKSHLALLTLLAAGVLITGAMLHVGEVEADPYCTNITCTGAFAQSAGPITYTSTVDCEWARMGAMNQLESQANCVFGFCDQTFTTITDCNPYAPGPWTVTMKLDYKCARCAGPFQQ